jgi:tRNA pseudouridine38-40 synthase
MRHGRPMTLVFTGFPCLQGNTLPAKVSFHWISGCSAHAGSGPRATILFYCVACGRVYRSIGCDILCLRGLSLATHNTSVWKLVLAYDGTDFSGWQVQPGLVTVQGELRDALARVTGEEVLPQGSGRTDAGVHALGQVASFSLAAPIPEVNLARALNRTLPPSIRVLSATRVKDDFHARHSAQAKTYEYRIFRGEICPPWQARYVYALPAPLDIEAMQRAAARVCGEHDFLSFAASDPDRGERDGHATPGDSVRFLHASHWLEEPQLLVYRVRGNGFLHHMVRNLVGTFLEVGRGNLRETEIPAILDARSRERAGPTAPARGLFLVQVDYLQD